MKKTYLIQYKLLASTNVFENRLKSMGAWIKYFDNSYLIESVSTAEEIYNQISIDFKDTSMFIIEVKADNYFGRMNTTLWDYIKLRNKKG